MKNTGKLILSEFFLPAPVFKVPGERQLHLDNSNFFIREIQEVFDRTDLPSGPFKFLFFGLFHGLIHFIIGPESILDRFYYILRRFLSLLVEYFYDYNCIRVDSVYDSPGGCTVNDSQFVVPPPDGWHRARMRKAKLLTKLKSSQQEAGFETGCLRKGRSFYLAFKPDERLAFKFHLSQHMSILTYCQVL